ncbi:MAG: IS110 family transposase, partial [Crocinitomicaceae bacterium]|nr:IS110 family transposase [Crocinitomicaceae bacterium]
MKELVLKQALGIDVSKASLSMCLGVMNGQLEKDFIPRTDVTNDLSGFKELSKWLKKVSAGEVSPIVVLEATGVYHEGISLYL